MWGGIAAVGRRAARLAAVTAALGVYLYGVLAVAVLSTPGLSGNTSDLRVRESVRTR